MTFDQKQKLTALAIVNIFETSRPFGDPAACVVLNDGAGISYGIAQFTHRSGSLLDVVEAYLAAGGTVGAGVIRGRLPMLRLTSRSAIRRLAADAEFKQALRRAAATREMRDAQQQVASDRYLAPACAECGRRGFVTPLSLAVVYDSMVHGSWERIAARVTAAGGERAWVTDYVRRRHMWLSAIPRLRATAYRTRFFLSQIAISNWDLKLPLNINGHRLRDIGAGATERTAAVADAHDVTEKTPDAAAGGILSATRAALAGAAARFDRVETAISSAVRRTDAAKSLWTTVGGTLWQAAWGVFGFAAGLPREIWIVVALIAAVLMTFYLYRQIALAKIREARDLNLTPSQLTTEN